MCRECNFLSVLRSSCFFHDTNRFHRRQSLTSPHTFVMPARYIRHINLENGLLSVSPSEVQWMNYRHGDREVYIQGRILSGTEVIFLCPSLSFIISFPSRTSSVFMSE